jgi:6-phosphofructokinase 1
MSSGPQNGRLALLVGGGPAPGINGVISAVTIEARNQGLEVLGVRDGFSWLMKGEVEHSRPLDIPDVKDHALRGGSILGTSRANPARSEAGLEAVLCALRQLGVTALVTIGGDDTAFSASQVYKRAGGAIRVAHVPKTIDNDLPLPNSTPTFGFETARQVGVGIVRNLAEDARTTSRWYLIVSMGRAAGFLALGIGKAAAATLTVIPEEFRGRPVTLDELCDILLGAILKRRSQGSPYGVAVLAEGLLEAIGELGLVQALGSEQGLARYGHIERDEHGHLRLGEIEFGRLLRGRLAGKLKELKLPVALVDKELGYELRCADPIPFDAEYTRDLGYGAVQFPLAGRQPLRGDHQLQRRRDEATSLRRADCPEDRADAAAQGERGGRGVRLRPPLHDPPGAGRLRGTTAGGAGGRGRPEPGAVPAALRLPGRPGISRSVINHDRREGCDLKKPDLQRRTPNHARTPRRHDGVRGREEGCLGRGCGRFGLSGQRRRRLRGRHAGRAVSGRGTGFPADRAGDAVRCQHDDRGVVRLGVRWPADARLHGSQTRRRSQRRRH